MRPIGFLARVFCRLGGKLGGDRGDLAGLGGIVRSGVLHEVAENIEDVVKLTAPDEIVHQLNVLLATVLQESQSFNLIAHHTAHNMRLKLPPQHEVA